jgi:putative ABC transport system ATP-binding protein
MNSARPIIEIRGLTKVYRVGQVEVPALRGVDLDVAPGEFLSVVGPSGSGKSTLFHIIGGLTPPTSGSVRLADQDLSRLTDAGRTRMRKTTVGFVFQKFNLLPNLTARDNIAVARFIAGRREDGEDPEFRKALDLLGIAHRLDHKPAALSGGEQQRIAIARAAANRPRIILADEPTGNLDPDTSTLVFDALMELISTENAAALIATHNHDLARRATRIVTLKGGRVEPLVL